MRKMMMMMRQWMIKNQVMYWLMQQQKGVLMHLMYVLMHLRMFQQRSHLLCPSYAAQNSSQHAQQQPAHRHLR